MFVRVMVSVPMFVVVVVVTVVSLVPGHMAGHHHRLTVLPVSHLAAQTRPEVVGLMRGVMRGDQRARGRDRLLPAGGKRWVIMDIGHSFLLVLGLQVNYVLFTKWSELCQINISSVKIVKVDKNLPYDDASARHVCSACCPSLRHVWWTRYSRKCLNQTCLQSWSGSVVT